MIVFLKSQNGFSLVEVLLYTAVFSLLMGALFALLSSFTASRDKQNAIFEVEQQGLSILQTMTDVFSKCDSVSSPAQAGSSSGMSLSCSAPLPANVSIALSSGKIFLQEGSSAAVELNGGGVEAVSLVFQNITRASGLAMVKVTFALKTTKGKKAQNAYNATFTTSLQTRTY